MHTSLSLFFRRRLFPATILVSFFVSSLPAQPWVGTGPTSKNIRAVVQSPVTANIMFAGAFGWGVFKSVDGGATWVNQKSGLTNTYVRSLRALDDNVVFAGTNDGVFKTTDGGATWAVSLATLNSVRSIAFDQATSSLYAATYGQGLYKSTNQGVSWSPLTVTDPVGSETLVRQRSVVVFGRDSLYVGGAIADIGAGGAFFKSIDGGLSWIQVQRSVGIRSSVMSIAINPSSPATWLIIGTAAKGVYRSRNAGTNWVSLNGQTLPNPLADSSVSSVAMSATTCYAGTDSTGRVYYRDVNDSLVGWSVATGLPGTQGVINNLVVSRASAAVVYAGTEGKGMYVSSTAGSSWIPSNSGMLGIDGRDVHVNGNGNVILATGFGDGIWFSSNKAVSWTKSDTLGTSNSITSLGTTGSTSQMYAAAYGTGVYKSTNGGAWWFITDSTVINHFVRPLATHPSDPAVVYAGTGNAVYKTTNAGTSWFAAGTGIPANTSIRSLELNQKNPSILFAGTDSNYLFRSTNAGTSWTNITNANGFLPQDIFIRTITVDTSSSGIMYVGADSGRIYRSGDGGLTWALRTQLPTVKSVRRILIHPGIRTTLIAGTFGSGVFTSVDSGAHWASFSAGLSDLEINSLACENTNPLTIYAGTANTGVFRTTYSGVNNAPVLATIGPKSVIAGQTLLFNVSATDPDATIPAITTSPAPAGSSFVDNANGTGTFSWATLPGDIGSYNVTLRASDGLAVDSEAVAISVLDPSQVVIDLQAEEGWNLLSVPAAVPAYEKTALFPGANSPAYAYQSGYAAQNILANGPGYWLKFPSAQTIQFGGGPIVSDTLNVTARWNIIGSISIPLPVGKVVPLSPATITSPFFGFSNSVGYYSADTIKPGRAYWVKMSQSGELVLDTSSLLRASSVMAPARRAGIVLTVTDNEEGRRVTSLALQGADVNRDLLDLPPAPPEGVFDIRWIPGSDVQGDFARLAVSQGHYPLRLTWVHGDGGAGMIMEITRNNHQIRCHALDVDGDAVVMSGDVVIVRPATAFTGNGKLPERPELRHNFPNPFNPATNITYSLPSASRVSLKVYNAIGQDVATIVDGMEESGVHDVLWDASEHSSGLYYCTLQVTDLSDRTISFRQTRTMVLLK